MAEGACVPVTLFPIRFQVDKCIVRMAKTIPLNMRLVGVKSRLIR